MSRSDGSGQTDISAGTAKKSPAAKPSAAAAPPARSQALLLAPDAQGDAAARAPEAKQTASRLRSEGLCRSLLMRVAI